MSATNEVSRENELQGLARELVLHGVFADASESSPATRFADIRNALPIRENRRGALRLPWRWIAGLSATATVAAAAVVMVVVSTRTQAPGTTQGEASPAWQLKGGVACCGVPRLELSDSAVVRGGEVTASVMPSMSAWVSLQAVHLAQSTLIDVMPPTLVLAGTRVVAPPVRFDEPGRYVLFAVATEGDSERSRAAVMLLLRELGPEGPCRLADAPCSADFVRLEVK